MHHFFIVNGVIGGGPLYVAHLEATVSQNNYVFPFSDTEQSQNISFKRNEFFK